MADDDLEALRARRLAELQKQYAGSGAPEGGDGNKTNVDDRKAKEAEFKNHVLTQLLSQEARARLNTLSLAKPGKAEMVENILINMARSGQLNGRLQESDLVNLLERVNEQTVRKTTVKFDRRRTAIDDSDDD